MAGDSSAVDPFVQPEQIDPRDVGRLVPGVRRAKGVPLPASTGAVQEHRSGAGLGGVSLLDPLRKSCGRADWGQVETLIARAKDCRCGACPKCSGKRAHSEALLVAQVAQDGKAWSLVTLTVDGTAFAGKECELLDHLKEVRAVAELCRWLRKRGIIGRKHYTAMEFQENGQVHFHILMNALILKRGEPYIDAKVVQQKWGTFRPEWAGPIQKYGSGKTPDALRPGLGHVDVRAVKETKEVIAYVTAYVGKPGKNPVPEWFLDYCGAERNAVLKMPSKGFFEGVKPIKERKPRQRPGSKKRRHHCRERLKGCRTATDVLRRVDTIRNGELVAKPEFQYVGTISQELRYSTLCHILLDEETAQRKSKQRGFVLNSTDLEYLLTRREFASSMRGFSTIVVPKTIEPERDESEEDWREFQQPDSQIWKWAMGLGR